MPTADREQVPGGSCGVRANAIYEGDATLIPQVLRRAPVIARPEDPLDRLADPIIADPADLAIVAEGVFR